MWNQGENFRTVREKLDKFSTFWRRALVSGQETGAWSRELGARSWVLGAGVLGAQTLILPNWLRY